MPIKKCDAAVVGEIYMDHIFTGFMAWPQPGEEVFTNQYKREIGGGAVNTACALARLGRTVRLVGGIGIADAQWFEARLLEFGVSTEGLTRTGGDTGVTVSVSMKNDRSFFSYPGENDKLAERLRSKDLWDFLTSARHVHFALPLEYKVAMKLLPQLKAAGCTTSLDVGFQPEWLRSPANLDICRAVDYLLPNEKEASLLCGGEASAYLSFAASSGFTQAVIKLGSRGAAMLEAGVRYQVSSPIVDVVDTTGAGDAFDAGFIDALLDDAGPEDRLRRACICGGLSTRVAGSLSALPTNQEIEDVYEQSYTS
jgi:sugar/nucleoside kinase (ribokinase family)